MLVRCSTVLSQQTLFFTSELLLLDIVLLPLCVMLCHCYVIRVLYENLSVVDAKSTRNSTGVQMVGVFVANGLLPYADDAGVSKDR